MYAVKRTGAQMLCSLMVDIQPWHLDALPEPWHMLGWETGCDCLTAGSAAPFLGLPHC